MYNKGDIIFYKDFKVKAIVMDVESFTERQNLYFIKVIKSFNINYPLNEIMPSILDRSDWFKIDGLEQVKKKQSHLPSWW